MLRGTIFTNANLSHVRFTKADLTDANLDNAILTNIKLGQYPHLTSE